MDATAQKEIKIINFQLVKISEMFIAAKIIYRLIKAFILKAFLKFIFAFIF